MNTTPKITIITVVRNAKTTVLQALESVASQNYPQLEHIVLDGLSTDGTQDIVNEFAAKHPHVYFRSQKDNGMYDALNQGIALATGDIIGMLHADDFYAHDLVLQEVVSRFKSGVEAVYSDLLYVDPKNTSKVVRYWQSRDYCQGDFAKGWCPPHPTFFVKKEVYQRFGDFDIQLPIGNDVELMMRLMEKSKISTRYCAKVWVVMRMGGISNQSLSNIIAQNKVIIKALKRHQLPHSLIGFVARKIIDRLGQYIKKPKGAVYEQA